MFPQGGARSYPQVASDLGACAPYSRSQCRPRAPGAFPLVFRATPAAPQLLALLAAGGSQRRPPLGAAFSHREPPCAGPTASHEGTAGAKNWLTESYRHLVPWPRLGTALKGHPSSGAPCGTG